ncbi:MAG: hypothetical protein C4309_06365, partial [Chloroflexota bacterium]
MTRRRPMAESAMVRKRSRRRQARMQRFGLAVPRLALPAIRQNTVFNGFSPGIKETVGRRLTWAHALSLLLLALCLGFMGAIVQGDEYYVVSPEIGGTRFVPPEEIASAAAVNGLHAFWVDPAQIEAAVRQVPNVADVRVRAAWPNRVTIEVTEREPVLLWMDGQTAQWADATGHLMPVRGQIEGLLTVVAEDGAISAQTTEKLPEALIAGALALHALVPQARELRYAPSGGLAFEDARGWTAYFGVGNDMAQKLVIYNALVASLEARGLRPLALVVDDVR